MRRLPQTSLPSSQGEEFRAKLPDQLSISSLTSSVHSSLTLAIMKPNHEVESEGSTRLPFPGKGESDNGGRKEGRKRRKTQKGNEKDGLQHRFNRPSALILFYNSSTSRGCTGGHPY